MPKSDTSKQKITRVQLMQKTAANLSDSGSASLSSSHYDLEPAEHELLGIGVMVTPQRDGKANGAPFFVPITNVAAVFYG